MATPEQIAQLRSEYDSIVKQRDGGAPKGEIKKAASVLAKTMNDIPGTTIAIKRNQAGDAILIDIADRLDDFTPDLPKSDATDAASPASVATDVASPVSIATDVASPGIDSDDDDVFHETVGNTPEPQPEPAPSSYVQSTWQTVTSLGGLLGVAGTAKPIVDTQRAKQTEDARLSLPAGYSTQDVPLNQFTPDVVDLQNWTDGKVREIKAQPNANTQAAIAGAAIEALRFRSNSAQASPHEAVTVERLMTAATQSAAPSPVRETMLQRIQTTQTKTPPVSQEQIETAVRGLSDTVGVNFDPRRLNLNPQFSSVATGPTISAAVTQTPDMDRVTTALGDVQSEIKAAADRTVTSQRANQRALRAAVTDTAGATQRAIAEAARRGELSVRDLQAIEENLETAPLMAQMVAQGLLKPHQAIDPADVASYENALRNRRVEKSVDGTESFKGSSRLAAQPVLTRYVPEDTGGRRYRPPRFAGPAY